MAGLNTGMPDWTHFQDLDEFDLFFSGFSIYHSRFYVVQTNCSSKLFSLQENNLEIDLTTSSISL